jgi:hypothetical protein
MQTLVQVICSKGRSLRESIVYDRRLADFDLEVKKQQQPGRAHGWASVRSLKADRRGALKIEWDADTDILLCRVVNRGAGKPNLVAGDFISYLLSRFRRRIKTVTIVPR